MSFLVLKTFGGAEYTAIVTDTEGNNKVFDSREDAEAEAVDCQEGIIVEL